MNKTDLIKEVSNSTNISEETVRSVLNSIISTIQTKLIYGVNVKIHGFMNYILEIRKESLKYNIQKKTLEKVPKRYIVKAKFPRSFTEKLAKKTVY